MKKIFSMMMIAAVAMMSTACDKDDEGTKEYTLSGTEYTGDLSVQMGQYPSVQNDIEVWAEKSSDGESIDVMFPGVTFYEDYMPALDMAFISVPQISDGVYYIAEADMVGITDHLTLINDIVQSITQLTVTCGDDGNLSVTFTCSISIEAGDYDVPVTYVGSAE